MIERHQDYLLTVASVPVGGIQGVPLVLDSDAPFAARLVRSRNIEIGLPDEPLVGWNFKNPDESFNATALRTDWIQPANNGSPAYPGRGSVLSPEIVFPASGIIYVDIGNPLNIPIVNAQLLFRGSKLYRRDGVSPYPPHMGVFPSTYQVVVPNVGAVQNILNNVLTIKNTADFVYRYGVCDALLPGTMGPNPPFQAPPLTGAPATQSLIANVYVQLKDESGKPYSNAPIHINDLFGQGFPYLPNNVDQATQDDAVLFTPGLITPEILIPKRTNFYFDVYRNDPGGVPVDLWFRFGGMGVYAE